VRSILEDRRGVVWIGTDNALFQVKGNKVQRVEMAPGVGPLAVHVISEDRQNLIWVVVLGSCRLGTDSMLYLPANHPDGTRIEFMEFKPIKAACCSPYTGREPVHRLDGSRELSRRERKMKGTIAFDEGGSEKGVRAFSSQVPS
jgi:hypothetical protein